MAEMKNTEDLAEVLQCLSWADMNEVADYISVGVRGLLEDDFKAEELDAEYFAHLLNGWANQEDE